MDLDKTFPIMLGLMMTILVLVIGAAIYCDIVNRNQHDLDRVDCEKRGGVQLDRTYTAGKNSTGHLYTCIRADVIL